MTNLSASDLAGRRIREARKRRDWTVRDLADHCAKAGASHITATVITNLETRRRATREITADELLVLSYVLDVPPLQLISPLNAAEQLQITPGLSMDALEAAAWLGNDSTVLQATLDGQDDARPQTTAVNPANILRRIRRASQLLRADYRALRAQKGNVKARDGIVQRGAHIMAMLGRLADLGYQPPELDLETAAALRECGQPASLDEWRAREEGDVDGES